MEAWRLQVPSEKVLCGSLGVLNTCVTFHGFKVAWFRHPIRDKQPSELAGTVPSSDQNTRLVQNTPVSQSVNEPLPLWNIEAC